MTPYPVVELKAIELREVALPLVRPFRTSFGEEREKRTILVRTIGDDVEGWGECVASAEPRYSEEWLDGAWMALERWMAPGVLGGEVKRPGHVVERVRWIRGHRMAKAALEAAVLDVWLRKAGVSLSYYLSGVRDRITCGVSVGIAPTVEEMLEEIRGYLAKGYRRIKMKIEPGRDLAVVRAVREALPDTPLSVDANGAYTPAHTPLFEALDELELMMIEQPYDTEDLMDHAALQARLRTPICLDESIRSARDAAAAIRLGACRVINIKPGRVGGILEAKRVHDVALRSGVPVWIGGMLETGVGRAANLALAALPGVTLPGDTSASDRYFADDVTEPFALAPDGTMAVPTGPGIGVRPRPERLV
ncbi:MAG TPA: o-succinylbenzoate synthase, partial [Actinomycetota bacterium]|nr:o-succinylbenzoate synthase [Actinomycetota bacterium]